MHAPLDPPHARDLWAPRRQLTLEQARKRSDLIKLLRMVFTACAAISIGVLVGQLTASTLYSANAPQEAYEADEVVTMKNPRFTGRDAAGEAFVITAESAERWRANPELIDLVNPTLIDEFGGRVSAPLGLYDQSAQVLELYEDVRIADASGYEFQTSSARILVAEGRVEGVEPLAGSGPLGDIRSDTYEIREDGEEVAFKGNVTMTILPAARPQDIAPEAEDTVDAVSVEEREDG